MRPRWPLVTLGSVVLVAALAVAAIVLRGRFAPPTPPSAPVAQTVPEPSAAPAVTQPAAPQPAPAETAPKPAPAAPAKTPTPKREPAAAPARTPAPKPAPAAPATTPAPEREPAPATPAVELAATGPALQPAASRGPFISVEMPAEGSVYHSTVTLTGRITDSSDSSSARQVKEASWEIPGTARSGVLSVSPTGAFSARVPTEGLESALTIVVRASSKDGGVSQTSITLADSGEGPGLEILSPAAGATYGSTVRVTGRVAGPQDAPDPLAEVDSLGWSVAGTDLQGQIGFGRGGAFAFSFSTVGQHGPLTVNVTARDRNGHVSRLTRVVPDRPGGPPLRIDSPAGDAEYADTVSVEGRAGDPSDPSGAPAELKSLGWRLVGNPRLSGNVSLEPDGSFRFSVPTAGLEGTQVLELRAEDLNGRATVRPITLSRRAAAAAAATAAPAASGAAPRADEPPRLVIESPADNAVYGASVTVKGRVSNSSSDAAADRIAAVTWSVAGTALSGTADTGRDGSFGFTVRTAGLRGTQALHVKASTRAGLTTEQIVVLLENERGLPVAVISPPDGGYYKPSTAIEGTVGGASTAGELKSFTWEVPGRQGYSGRIMPDANGKFRFAVPFAQLSGDVTLRLTSEDLNGHRSQVSLTLHDGSLKPLLTISAPLKGSSYGSVLRVAGSVKDPYAGQPGMEGIESISWLLSPVDFSRTSTPARGTAVVGPGGAFRFSVPAGSLSGQQDLTVTAVGKSGNRTDVTLRLAPAASDLPSFAVAPSDGRMTVSWDPVPFAARYDLAWVQGTGAPETGSVQKAATSPVTLSGLSNGALYSVRVQLLFDDGGVGASTVAQVIPLSRHTLAPSVKGDYQKIRLSWDSIPGTGAYEVWRSTTEAGGYTRVATALASPSYVDAAVQFGTTYYYTVAPSGAAAPMSASSSGRSLAFPVEKLAGLGRCAARGARRVTVNGGYAFVASGAAGVRIVDVSDPEKPVAVGLIEAEDAWDVAVRGTYAYVADGPAGLRVVDVSAPREPVLLGTRRTSDARAVALAGDFAYVADGEKGLKVIDVSDVRTLARVATLETVNALDLAASGTSLLLADGQGGLKVVDISRPSSPVVASTLAMSDARSIAFQPGLALVADGPAGLRIVDVADLRTPSLLATFGESPAAAVSAEEGFAYVTDTAGAIRVVDLEDPAAPALFTAHAVPGAAGIDVQNHHAYIVDGANLQIMRVQIQGRSFCVASAATGGKAYGVSISGDWAYVAAHAAGLAVVDARNPPKVTDASLAASFATRFALSVSLEDRLAFVADGESGLRIIDVSRAWGRSPDAQPSDVGAYRPGGMVSRAVSADGTAFIAAGDQGVRVLDVRTPSAPVEIASVRTRDASDLVVKDQLAWVADGDGGVRAIDVTIPAQPKLLSATLAMNARFLALSGDLLFAAGSAGVTIIDISDPRAPVVKGRYDTPAVEGIAARGAYLYVAEGYRGLTIVDVSRPARPAVVSSCEDVFALGVAVKDDYAFVADARGLKVVQILIPEWLR